MAQALGLRPHILLNYFAGRQFPESEQRKRLYELTSLECFGSGADNARHLHRMLIKFPTPWARDLLIKAHRCGANLIMSELFEENG
jgi:hypothetical protein